MEEKRPDPEKLLQQIKEKDKQRGKLKIFFGACAGAGKTYAMLSAAQEKHRENMDVVAGIVESHGRSETARLKEGLATLPLRQIEYQGITLKEFNLDAALEREPNILLVDELAHTNAVGSRHAKRWQDVHEILEKGIDVYTTLNVQHIESLNDTVANLTGVRVKETVPDSIFDNADEIVLVDVPSEVILERLEEGKVYLGEFTKQRAAQHFFKIENLMALREIALRRTAERVDALRDTFSLVKMGTKKGLIGEKILVCIGPQTVSTKLIRTAKQQASRLRCPWTAIYIETEAHYLLSEEERIYIEKTLHLAEQLGGKRQILQETNKAHAIIRYASENNFTRILVGKVNKSKWKIRLNSSFINELIEKSGNIDIYVTHEDLLKIESKAGTKHHPWFSYLSALAILSSCTLLGMPLEPLIGPENEVMIYLAGLVIIAVTSERSIALGSALVSVALYKYFFTHPYYRLDTYETRDIITLSVFLLTSLVISTLTAKLRLQHLFSQQREKYTNDLYALSRKLMVTTGKNKIVQVASTHISDTFNCTATIWLPDAKGYLELTSHPDMQAELKEASVAQWAYTHIQAAGLGTDTMPSARGYYLPLSTGNLNLGVLGIISNDKHHLFTNQEKMMLEALALQIASALARVKHIEQQVNLKPKN